MDRNAVEDFFAKAPQQLVASHKLLQEIRWAPNAAARQKILGDLCLQISALKGQAVVPELQPAWQMACALEGLVRQLTARASNVTSSTLRTIGISLDLLDDLCVEGLRADLATYVPIRLLAVDDDPISRHALSRALKMALSQPDQAENGEAALALVTHQPYDVIFLDVQMPGMDGFELCSKIHETVSNRITPVVFVTCQGDFNARAESTLCGGNDLIEKPFLTFEITLIALTLALRRRLQAGDLATESSKGSIGLKLFSPSVPETGPLGVAGAEAASPASPSADCPTEAQIPPRELRRRGEKTESPAMPGDPYRQGLSPTDRSDRIEPCADMGSASETPRPFPESAATASNQDNSMIPSEPPANELAKAFFTHVPSHIGALRDLIQVIIQSGDMDARQEMLGDLHLFIHSLTINAGLVELRPAFQLSAALEGLLNKLIESRANSTGSTLQTVATAVDLLNDLCVEGLTADVAANPPIRMLVVDDDPIARRALSGVLQMVFEKPDLAENGEAALTLATQQSYDVIFLDVLMPGMDGFTLCPRIHGTTANSHTPVVFVTSHADLKLATRSTLCGGRDFITKPFLTAEITVKALVYALRHRLQKLGAKQGLMPQQTEDSGIVIWLD
jgi:CheY-like chemotaxis protein